MKKFLLVLCLVGTLATPAASQHVPVVMNLSAHPDDEDGATLAYYRFKYGVKTYSVCFTWTGRGLEPVANIRITVLISE